ncbi:MAG: RNA methyltransferase [Lachnospiraceae bacterium]|nr:RNA methyltransferase [Lachnospiraceae bacterium]
MRQIRHISETGHPELEVFTALNEPQLYHYYEPAPGLFIAETPNVIIRALNAGYEPVCMLCEESRTGAADQILEGYPDLPVYVCTMEVLKQITGYSLTHGMLCSMRRKKEQDAGKLLERIVHGREDGAGASDDSRRSVRIAVLEDVVNPTNAGAIFRSAAALGMDAVFLTQGCADPLQRRCIRVSMGTVFQIPWARLKENWICKLHEEGFLIAAMALEKDSISVSDPSLKRAEHLAVVLGSEGYGLRKETILESDATVLIPMKHNVDSLNVAAAAAVAFWEMRK